MQTMLWVARLTGTIAVVPLMMIMIGEPGPTRDREWLYLAFFPCGFSVGYLLGWRWPLLGGALSLACMAVSLVVIGRILDSGPYLIWGALSIPGVLYVLAGLKLRTASARG
jgi:hypothetical protein